MTLRAVVVNPGGNRTAILSGTGYNWPGYRFCDVMREAGVEQAGVVKMVDGLPVLRMMGWELSLNGLVSAAVASQVFEQQRSPEQRLACDLGGDTVAVDADLAWRDERLVDVRLRIGALRCVVEEQWALGAGLRVAMDGIQHTLFPMTDDREVDEEQARSYLRDQRVGQPAQTALIHSSLEGTEIELTPLVHVSAVGTTVLESSCGSGAVALGVAAAHLHSRSDLLVRHPSGSVTSVSVEASDEAPSLWSVRYSTTAMIEFDGIY